MERRHEVVWWPPHAALKLLGKRAALAMILLSLATPQSALAQDDRAQRIQALESRILDVKARIWVDRVEAWAANDHTCADHNAKAKAYYDEALALNEQYRGRATEEYQRQINVVKARNRQHIDAYKRCFEQVMAYSGERYQGVETYEQFHHFGDSLAGRLADAPADLVRAAAIQSCQNYGGRDCLVEQQVCSR